MSATVSIASTRSSVSNDLDGSEGSDESVGLNVVVAGRGSSAPAGVPIDPESERPYSLGGWTRSDHDWRRHAACSQVDPNLFFPVGVTGPAVPQIDEAKQVCAHCPVRMACLDFAILTNQQYGVWGGCTEDERRAIRRRWRRARVVAFDGATAAG